MSTPVAPSINAANAQIIQAGCDALTKDGQGIENAVAISNLYVEVTKYLAELQAHAREKLEAPDSEAADDSPTIQSL